MKLDTIKTTMKALAKLNKLEVKLDKDGKDFTDTNNLNSAAKCVHYALSTNGLYNFYRPDTWFMDFLQHLCERRDFMGDYYGIGSAVATYGKDVIMYAANAINDAYHEAYTSTHDLDDLHLRGNDIEKICTKFLDDVKSNYHYQWNGWSKFISEMSAI